MSKVTTYQFLMSSLINPENINRNILHTSGQDRLNIVCTIKTTAFSFRIPVWEGKKF